MIFSNKRLTAWLSALIAMTLFLIGCETEHHDYIYNLKVSTSNPVHVSYQIKGEDSTHYATLQKGDIVRLCKRSGVAGDDIWDIETSSSIYKVESLYAYSEDSSSMTENLNRRSYWSKSPDIVGDSAFYTIDITDQCFILNKQLGYTYKAISSTQDSIVITCIIGDEIVKDTLFGAHNSTELGSNDIYVYNGNAKKSDQDKDLQRLSGLTSISMKLKQNGTDFNRSISLQREDSLFTFNEKECILNIKEWHFNTKQNNRK